MGLYRWPIILVTLIMLTLINACGTRPQTLDLPASDIRPTAAPAPVATSTAATGAHASSAAGTPGAQSPTARAAHEGVAGAQPALPFYGIQYVPLAELPHVRALGFDVVLTDFAYDADPATWVTYLDTARALRMRVIPWLWPEGWTLDRRTGAWTIDATARRFLETVARHPATFAIYGLHEPYWNECDTCGYTTAEQQALYTAIKRIAPVPIYSEINGFTFWAEASRAKTIAPGVCDYCQTAFYPFLDNGSYQRDELIAHIEREIATLQRYAPESRLIWTMPAMAHRGDRLRMPTSDEMWDYANLVYGRPEISGAWWYMWRWDNQLYSTYLAEHPELHPTVRNIADAIVAPRRPPAPEPPSSTILIPLISRSYAVASRRGGVAGVRPATNRWLAARRGSAVGIAPERLAAAGGKRGVRGGFASPPPSTA